VDGLGRRHHFVVRRPAGRAWKPRLAGRPAPPITFKTEELSMSLRRDEHAQKRLHRCCGGER
jgi:hypothetical protein